MDRRTLIAITLSVAIYLVWFALFPPAPPAEPEPGSTDAAQIVPAAPADAAPAADPAVGGTATAADRAVPFALCALEGQVHTRDGALTDVVRADLTDRYDTQPLWQWVLGGFQGAWKPYGDAPGPARLLGARASGFVLGSGPLGQGTPVEVVSARPGELVVRGVTAEGVVVERALRASGQGQACTIDLTVRFSNPSGASVGGPFWLGLHEEQVAGATSYDLPMRPRAYVAGAVEGIDEPDDLDGVQRLEGAPGWLGLADMFFLVGAAPAGGNAPAAAVFSSVPSADGVALYGVHHVWDGPLGAGATLEATYRLYGGLKTHGTLVAVSPELGDAVELGFFSAFGWPLLWLLEQLHGFAANWGVAIILLTLLVKAVFFPLTQAGFKSSQAMQALQPQMQALRDTYKDNPEELNRRTMQLFTENKVNPLGGCLPMLLQMPVWFALFAVLQNTADLYHSEFLYLRDLSRPDPYMAGPVLVSGLMMLQQRLTPMGNLDPAQQQMMKIMPVIFSIFFFLLPSGLVVYTFVNMSLSILQQAYIKRTFRKPSAEGAPTTA